MTRSLTLYACFHYCPHLHTCACTCTLPGSGDTASELLVSMGSGTSLEDFYPSIAINSLMRILKDQSLSQHHTMAIQALGFIFKSLGIKSVPYLPQVCIYIAAACTTTPKLHVQLQVGTLYCYGFINNINTCKCRYIDKSKCRDVWYVIIPTILVCVLFGPAVPTSSFNFINLLK